MKKIEKLFSGLKMGWLQVLLFSLAVGVFCGIFGGLPILKDTSFTDMAGGYEWWIVFAVIITVNCDKWWDAGLKCGVFFLITQPLQFYIQAALYSHNFAYAWVYTKMWMPVIIATFFGGAIAHFAKKENWLGSIVLGIGDAMELFMFVAYGRMFLETPPRHLIATLFSLAAIAVMTFTLQKKTKFRIITLATCLVVFGAVLAYVLLNGLTI